MGVFSAIDLLMPLVVLLLWYLFGRYSYTAENHGRWVAFLMPIAFWLFLLLYIVLALSRIFVYPLFVMLGKRATYHDFIYRVKNPWLWGFKGFSQDTNHDQGNSEKENTDNKT